MIYPGFYRYRIPMLYASCMKCMQPFVFFLFAFATLSVAAQNVQPSCGRSTQSSSFDDEVRKRIHSGLLLVEASEPAIRAAYEPCGFLALWSVDGRPSSAAAQLISELRESRARGLEPESYAVALLNNALDELKRKRIPETFARFDLLLTLSALHFIEDLHCGEVAPVAVHADMADHCDLQAPERNIWQLVGTSSVHAVVDGIESQAPGYQRTKRALLMYQSLSGTTVLPTIAARVCRPGDRDPALASIAEFLIAVGDLDPRIRRADSALFDGPLVEAVRTYQSRHGINPTGTLDRNTLAAMKVSLSDRTQQLAFTLERWRWVPKTFSQPPVVVNIPEFRLRVYDESLHVAFSMKVIVGGAYRRQTPVFENQISSVIFRPYWNIPPSIQRNEIMPKARRDPGFLSRHGYEIVHEGSSIRIRQKPGENNSLGLIKFSLPNNHNVYLHGTPAQSLFQKIRRDFSHGCIRVEGPTSLAVWTLRNNDGWSREAVEEAMHGQSNRSVALKYRIPVLIVYGTGFASEDGRVYFLPYIYGQDKVLLNALRQVRTQRAASLNRAWQMLR